MLILTRRIGESLIIGDDIKVTVLSDSDQSYQVKLGIDAPREVSVHREEVYDRIQREKEPDDRVNLDCTDCGFSLWLKSQSNLVG